MSDLNASISAQSSKADNDDRRSKKKSRKRTDPEKRQELTVNIAPDQDIEQQLLNVSERTLLYAPTAQTLKHLCDSIRNLFKTLKPGEEEIIIDFDLEEKKR